MCLLCKWEKLKVTIFYYDTTLENVFFIFLKILSKGIEDRCDGCQRTLNSHHKRSADNKWDYKTCTVLESTDAFSQQKRILKFIGFKTKKAKVNLKT